MTSRRRFTLILAALAVAACSTAEFPTTGRAVEPAMAATYFVARDGYRLPTDHWAARGEPKAVVIALHGMNDYGHAFALPGPWWAERGLEVYAYDQRGFGRGSVRGIWPGSDRLVDDLSDVVGLIRKRHPGRKVYLAGESMGAAVVLAALARGAVRADGAVLTAPAVWGRQTMNPFYRGLLWLTSSLFPGGTSDGRGIHVQASDNVALLRDLGRDPFVVKKTRADAVKGLVDLMDEAFAAPSRLPGLPLLVLYGQRDQIIPKRPVQRFVDALGGRARVALYSNGWHLLLRDLQRETVWADILAWVGDPLAPLPSGAERTGRPLLEARSLGLNGTG